MNKTKCQIVLFPLLLLMVASVLMGCTIINDNEPEKSTLTVTPFDLFEGESERFKPVLGDYAGAVKVDYTGEKADFRIKTEVWENGEKTEDVGGLLGDIAHNHSSEIIVVITTIDVYEDESYYKIKVSQNEEGSHTTYTQWIEKPSEHKAFNFSTMFEPKNIFKGENVVIMGLKGTSGSSLRSGLGVEDAEWMLVFKVEVEEID